MPDMNEPGKKKPGRKPWTEEQKAAKREWWAEQKAKKAEKEREEYELYQRYKDSNCPSPNCYSKEANAKRSATLKATDAKRRAERERLIEENPDKTKTELGIPETWMTTKEKEEKHNRKFLRYARVPLDLPPIDICNAEQVERRIADYFDFCEANNRKPRMVGMANWLGVNKKTLDSWKKGILDKGEVGKVVEKAMLTMEEFMLDDMQNVKGNPANLIFLMKNLFGYKDQTDIVVAPTSRDESEMSKEDLEKWFLEDGKSIEQTFPEDE